MFNKLKEKVNNYFNEHPNVKETLDVVGYVTIALGSLCAAGVVGYKMGSDITECKVRHEYTEKEGQRILKILQDSIPKDTN